MEEEKLYEEEVEDVKEFDKSFIYIEIADLFQKLADKFIELSEE